MKVRSLAGEHSAKPSLSLRPIEDQTTLSGHCPVHLTKKAPRTFEKRSANDYGGVAECVRVSTERRHGRHPLTQIDMPTRFCWHSATCPQYILHVFEEDLEEVDSAESLCCQLVTHAKKSKCIRDMAAVFVRCVQLNAEEGGKGE